MPAVLALWHAEHLKFARLLNLLERELNQFHVGAEPNYALMTDIVFYLRNYADTFHHPREDIGFARLVQIDPDAATIVGRLLQEHRVIGEAGRQLHERLLELQSDAVMPRGLVEEAAATYLVYYRHHLAREEGELLPRIARQFSAQDWDAVQAGLDAIDDPLFGGHVDERFRELSRQISREASATG